MINVMMIIPTLDIAGAEKLVTDLSIGLSLHNCTVEILTFFTHTNTEFEQRIISNNIKLTTMNKRAGTDIKLLFKLKKYIMLQNPDIIHAHLNTLFYMLLLPKMYKKRVVFTVHTLAHKEATGLHMYARKRFFKTARFVAISSLVYNSIASYYGSNGILINNAVDTSLFTCSRDFSRCNQIITIGRLSTPKNHALLIDAFAIVHAQFPDLTLSIYGEGELRRAIIEQIARLQLSNHVTLHGITTSVSAVLTDSDIFALTSTYEGFGLVVAEAMASGLPIVSTKNGGAENIIDDGINGFLADSNPQEFANKIITLINDKDLRERLGANAVTRAKQFDLPIMVDEYMQLYADVIDSNK